MDETIEQYLCDDCGVVLVWMAAAVIVVVVIVVDADADSVSIFIYKFCGGCEQAKPNKHASKQAEDERQTEGGGSKILRSTMWIGSWIGGNKIKLE